MQKALVYCRVSSQRQVSDGHGLESQETRCRAYARQHGYHVVSVFRDEAVSGGLFQRRAMQELICFLKDHHKESFVVIFDDLKRFARDVNVHLRLKAKLLSYGAKLECLNFRFEDSPEGRFIELIIAGQGQLEREQNGRQVKQKMKARMQAGYWCMQAPTGYQFVKDSFHGKVIAPIPAQQTLIKKAIEGFASKQFLNQIEVLAFLKAHHFREKSVYKSLVHRILTNPIYAGYYQYDPWNIPWTKAKHTPMISLQTFEAVQKRLAEQKRSISPVDNQEFPLRGLINCSYCGKKLTASKVKGRSKYYSMYSCQNTACNAKPKNIRKNVLETDYNNLIVSYGSSEKAVSWFKYLVIKQMQTKVKEAVYSQKILKEALVKVEKQQNTLIERLSNTCSEHLIKTYEKKITEFAKQIQMIKEKQQHSNCKDSFTTFRTAVEEITPLLENTYKHWKNWNLRKQHAFHETIFSADLEYSQNNGFRTARKPDLFYLIDRYKDGEFHMVDYLESNWNQIIQQITALQRLLTSN